MRTLVLLLASMASTAALAHHGHEHGIWSLHATDIAALFTLCAALAGVFALRRRANH